MDDRQAGRCLTAAMNLAVTIRDEGPDAVQTAARELLAAANQDPIAALAITAALINVDQEIEVWWTPDDKGTPRQPLAPCGTRSAAIRHRQRGELMDDACRLADAEYQRQFQAQKRRRETAAPRVLSPCGTHAAYERHRRRGERVDEACRAATAAYKTARNRARREADAA
jgi:hypothetical protein